MSFIRLHSSFSERLVAQAGDFGCHLELNLSILPDAGLDEDGLSTAGQRRRDLEGRWWHGGGLSAGPFQFPEQVADLFMGFLAGPDDQCPAMTPIVDGSRTALGCPMAGGNGFLD